MGVTIRLHRWGEGEIMNSTVQFTVNDIELKLVDCIQDYLGGEHYISFVNYYQNANMMIFGRVYPYIIKNGVCYWYVSYHDISIKEFMITHSIPDEGIIDVEIDQFGGGGELSILAIIGWVMAIVDYVEVYETALKCVDFICKHFIGENRQIIDIIDVIDMVQKKAEWKLDELIPLTKCEDTIVLESVLKQAGYRFRDGSFVFDKPYWNDLLNDRIEIENPWKVEPVIEEYQAIAYYLAEINKFITAIKYQKETNSIHYYNTVRFIADQLRKRWSDVICRGRYFQYLKIRKNAEPLDDIKTKKMERDVEDVRGRIEAQLIQFDDEQYPPIWIDPQCIGK